MILKKFVKYVNSTPEPIERGGTGKIPTNVTIGKEYELIETFQNIDNITMHKIVNDRGKNTNYMASRFEKPIQKIMLCKKDGTLHIVEKEQYFTKEQNILFSDIFWQEFDERIIYFKGGTKNLKKAIISDLCDIGYEKYVSVDKLTEVAEFLYRIDTRKKDIKCVADADDPQIAYTLPEDYDTILKEAKRLMQNSVVINPIGSQQLSIEITVDKLKTKYGEFSIGELKKCIDFYIPLFTKNCSPTFGQYPTALVLNKEDRVIRIGCEDDNNLFSMKELGTILEVWSKNFGK